MRPLLLLVGCPGVALALVLVADRFSGHESRPELGATPHPLDELDWRSLPAGEPAPPFALLPVGGGPEVTLAGFRGRPVVLVFGSFTCNMFCGHLTRVAELARAFEGRVPFVFVYVRDAGHPPPTDGPLSRYKMGLDEPQRRQLISDIWNETGLPLQCLDGCESPVPDAYHAFPMRLLVIDATGRVAYDAGNSLRGGWDFSRVRKILDSATRTKSAE